MKGASLRRLSAILDTLESFHGSQTIRWPADPYDFLVWWHCGYPASEERCVRGWESLNEAIGTSPKMLVEAPYSKLTRALKSGGMVPELRARRLKEIAQRVEDEFDGDLRSALSRLPLTQARRLLRTFPGIANPGADRIVLFGGIATVAAVPSSCPDVLIRIRSGRPHEAYNTNYREAQQIIQNQVADTFAARTRAYLLVQQHGRRVCKHLNPECSVCPVSGSCAFFAVASRIARRRAARR